MLRHDTLFGMPAPTLQEQFGQIDIYLFDQLLKGRIAPGMRIGSWAQSANGSAG